jgi:hypothetical protein
MTPGDADASDGAADLIMHRIDWPIWNLTPTVDRHRTAGARSSPGATQQ